MNAILKLNIMKKLLLLMSFIAILTSCSTDDDSQPIPDPIQGCTDPQAVNYNSDAEENDNSCLYSIVGVWELTSAILNGQEIFGDVVKSELYLIYDESDDFTLGTSSYTDTNYTDLYIYSIGTWSLPNSQVWNSEADVYDASGNFLLSYDLSSTVTEINGNIFEFTTTNYPNSGDVYIKRLSKSDVPLPELLTSFPFL